MLDFRLSDEQEELVRTTRQFTKDRIIPIAAECDAQSKFPKKVFTEYGGSGLSELDTVLITEELAYGCTGIQTSMTANGLAATPVLIAGNDAQKKKYLGMLGNEPVYAAYAITEPAAGSDAAGIQCRARKDGNDYILNGQKCFITNGAWASWYTVFATTDPELRPQGHHGVHRRPRHARGERRQDRGQARSARLATPPP
jgi:acyl-CoA dehydrogenase